MKKARARRSEREERTRERILLYSGNLFRQRGIRKVTVDEICAGMALSKRTFYKYFRGRDDLVEALIMDTLAQVAVPLRKNLESGGPAAEILREHFRQIKNLFDTRVSVLMMADVQTMMPELWARLEEFRRGIIDLMIEIIRRGQAEGDIRADIDADALGKVIQGAITAVANPVFALANGLSLDQVAGTLMALVLHGLIAESKPARAVSRKNKGKGR